MQKNQKKNELLYVDLKNTIEVNKFKFGTQFCDKFQLYKKFEVGVDFICEQLLELKKKNYFLRGSSVRKRTINEQIFLLRASEMCI